MSNTLNKETLLHYQAIANILHHIISVDPNTETLEQFKQDELAVQWPRLADNVTEENGIALLSEYLKDWQGTEEETLHLRRDFTRLFCGPGKPLAGPWGSIYLCEGDLLNDDSTKALQQFYNQHNIKLDLSINEPVDHLGMMFAVLAHLLGLLAENDADAYQQQVISELLRTHMLPFAYRVLNLMQENALTAYFEGMGILGCELLKQLSLQFNIIPVSRKLYN